MSKIIDLVDYYRTACKNHKDILHTDENKHFFRFNTLEMLSALRTEMKYPAFGLENFSGNIGDVLSDNKRSAFNVAFILIKPCELDNYDEQEEIIDEMYELGIDFLGKMHKDLHIQGSFLKQLDFNDVDFSPVGPIFENHYGYRFAFNINNPAKIRFEAAKWNDETNYP